MKSYEIVFDFGGVVNITEYKDFMILSDKDFKYIGKIDGVEKIKLAKEILRKKIVIEKEFYIFLHFFVTKIDVFNGKPYSSFFNSKDKETIVKYVNLHWNENFVTEDLEEYINTIENKYFLLNIDLIVELLRDKRGDYEDE